MVKNVYLGEEIVINTKNKIGLLADISTMLANNGVNVDAVVGYEVGTSAKLMLVTNANIRILNDLRKKKYKLVKEAEVVIVDLENKPGALKVVTTELRKNKIDIKYLYVTACSCGCSSRMVLSTDDNETAIALLSKFMK